ncbi:MAG: GAF domain-containing sensor histidine kinase [Thermoleophilia bacterium]
MAITVKRRHTSIFRKTAIIFVVVSLVPVAILGLRSHHIFVEHLDKMVKGGLITSEQADTQVRDLETQAVVYCGYGLVIALILGYFFAGSLVKPIRTLQQGARKIGDGNLDHRVETDTEDELEELATTINQMAQSLQTREAEIERRSDALSILYEVAHTMAESRDQNELLDNALDKAVQITGSATGCILLQNDDGNLTPVICRSSNGDRLNTEAQAQSSGIFDGAAREATRAVKPAVLEWPAGGGAGVTDAGGTPEAIACVPLQFEGKLQGAICVTGAHSDFDKETLDLISAIGSEVAVAIENTRLFEQLEAQNLELAAATVEIASLISLAEEQKSFGTRYQNPYLVRCWEFKDCDKTGCPAYGSGKDLRCWQVAGTHCGGEVQGVFAQKLGRCERCDVFKAACPNRITQLGETFNNMMAVLEHRVKEQEELQRQLFSSSKLAAIGELAAGVAHEINNPLTGILGSALLMKSRDLDPEAMRRKLEVIESETLRARDIVRNLLDFAHQGGRLDTEPVSVKELIEHTLFLLRHQTDMSLVTVQTSFQDKLPPVAVDSNLMKQVFLNIIHNAIQSMPGGGDLVINARGSQAPGASGMLEVCFTDTGSGMDDIAIARAFDPFFTTKPVGEGTGLGLSVSQKIVSEHGGEIRVTSVPEVGSTFSVILPAAGSTDQQRRDVA